MEIFKLFGTIMVDNSKANKELEETDKKAEDTAKSMDQITQEAGIMAAAIATAATAIVSAIGVKSVMAFDDLQKSMNKLQAQTGATDAEMKEFESSAKKLYEANYGENFGDIANSMSEIARTTGLTGGELESTTKNALALRDTFEMGVNETARTANSLMKNFGISADQAYTLIAQGAQQGANKNGDLLDTLNEYSVQFSSMGMSAEEFTGVLIDGAKNGAFSIDKVGDAVKEFTIRSKDGSKTSTEAFQKLGLDATSMTNAFAAGGDQARNAFDKVVDTLAAIEDPVKKNSIGVALFGTQFEDLEAKAIESLGNIQSQTDQNANTLEKINQIKTESFGAQLSSLGRQLTVNFFIPLGEKIMPLLEEFATWITDNEQTINGVLGGAVDVVASIFNGFANAIKFVIDNFNIFGPILAGITAAIIAQQVISWISGLYTLWSAATATQTTLQWLLNAAINASPFGLIALAIGAVIAVGVLLIQNWDTVKNIAYVVWGAIKTAVSSVWTFFSTIVGGIFNGIKNVIVGTWNGISAAASFIWGGIKTIVTGAFNGVISFFKTSAGIVGTIFKTMGEVISGAFTLAFNVIKIPLNGLITILNLVGFGIETLLNLAAKAINSIPDISIPNWVPIIGGSTFGIPDVPIVDIPEIPKLAVGGTITRDGTVLVGEEGPELLDLPRGASVIPLDKAGNNQSIVINITNPQIFNDRDAEKFGDMLVRYLKMKGIQPRGV